MESAHKRFGSEATLTPAAAEDLVEFLHTLAMPSLLPEPAIDHGF